MSYYVSLISWQWLRAVFWPFQHDSVGLNSLFSSLYVYKKERKTANLKPTGITLKRPKYGKQTLARYQEDNVRHFCSIHTLYFRLQNTFVNSHTNPYNLRHRAWARGGDAHRKFWIKLLKETNLGVAQPFLTPKRDHFQTQTTVRACNRKRDLHG